MIDGNMVARSRVSVIVPVRDDPRLELCLEGLRAQTYPANLVEIVVADNGCHMDPVVIADRVFGDDRERIRVVRQPDGGSYAARNVALGVATGALVAFTDADCRPEATWLANAVTCISHGADIVAGRVQVFARDPRRPHPVEAYELVHAFPQEVYVSRGGASVTANLVTRRLVIDDVGPFLHLESGADIEWSQRANVAGYRTVYAADAVVLHPARHTYAQLHGKLRRVIAGRAERDRREGRDAPLAWPRLRAWIPPVGSTWRALHDRALITNRARAALIVGEFYHRYASAVVAAQLAARSRRHRSAASAETA